MKNLFNSSELKHITYFLIFGLAVSILSLFLSIYKVSSDTTTPVIEVLNESEDGINANIHITISNLQFQNNFLLKNFNKFYNLEINDFYQKKKWEEVINVYHQYAYYKELIQDNFIEILFLVRASYAYYRLALAIPENTNGERENLLEKAENLIDQHNAIEENYASLFLKALILLEKNNVDKHIEAIDYIEKAIRDNKKKVNNKIELENYTYHIAVANTKIGYIYHDNKDYIQANHYFREAMKYLQTIKTKKANTLKKDLDRLIK